MVDLPTRILSWDTRSGDPQDFAASGDPQFRVSRHLLTVLGTAHRFLHSLFNFPQTISCELHDNLIEVAGDVRKDAGIWHLERGDGFFQLSGKFPGTTRFRDKSISNDKHGLVSCTAYSDPLMTHNTSL